MCQAGSHSRCLATEGGARARVSGRDRRKRESERDRERQRETEREREARLAWGVRPWRAAGCLRSVWSDSPTTTAWCLERETETERVRDTESQRQTDTQREKDTERERERERERVSTDCIIAYERIRGWSTCSHQAASSDKDWATHEWQAPESLQRMTGPDEWQETKTLIE